MSRSMTRWERWRDSRLACWRRSQGRRTQEVGTFVPLHCKASGVGKAAVAVAYKDVGQGREQDAEALTNGDVRYELKTPYRDGTTHVIFEPLDFIARLVALVAKPRFNLP